MKNRYMVLADLHLGDFKQFASIDEKGLNSRAKNVVDAVDCYLKYCTLKDIKATIIAGDLVDSRSELDVGTIHLFAKLMRSADFNGQKLYILEGNHEYYSSHLSILDLCHSGNTFLVKEHPMYLEDDIILLPYTPDWMTHIKALLERNCAEDFTIISHYSILDFKTKEAIPEIVDICSKFKQVILGDYHTPNKYGENIYYVGSPVQHDFAEGHTTGGIYLTPEFGVTYFPMYDRSPKFHKVSKEYDFRTISPRDFVWIETDTVEEQQHIKKQLTEMGVTKIKTSLIKSHNRMTVVEKANVKNDVLSMAKFFMKDYLKTYDEATRRQAYLQFKKRWEQV